VRTGGYTICKDAFVTFFGLVVCKALHNSAPRYLSEFVVPIASTPTSRRLSSAYSHCIIEPRSRLKFGDRGFSAAAP